MASESQRRTNPSGAHLVGSVPLADSESVFRAASSRLGKHLTRIPDGETGVRTNWVQWQFPLLEGLPQFERTPPNPRAWAGFQVQLRPGVSASEVELPALGYAESAIESYAVFQRLKSAGVIATGTRFQVSLPTPLAVVYLRMAPRDQVSIERVYERRLMAELDEISDAVPHDELAVQWDTAVEFVLLEGMMETQLSDPFADIVERLVALGDRVPSDVELGYHLCYGDVEHRHFKEPADAGKLVDVANGIAAGISRPLNWVHMPVPRDRNDAAYFEPLRQLSLPAESELYLGLVHLTDGAEGTRARIATAQGIVEQFGVATECGFGRRDPATIPDLLDLHAAIVEKIG